MQSETSTTQGAGARRATILFFALLTLLLLFRVWYGLLSDFWTDDELQTYLIGLKFYATGAFPFFGADITRGVQLFGALQGLVVGVPLYVLPQPETPIIFVNLLSFAALSLFAWYVTRRLPALPGWFVWTWTMTAPWTLNFSAHVVNPSYVLAGSVVFFVAWFETCPGISLGLIPARWCDLMMGAGLAWVMQFHMSWVVLPPFVLASLYLRRRRGCDVRGSVLRLALGASVPALLLAPTFWRYGLAGGTGNTGATIVRFNSANLKDYLNPVEGILGRFLSLGSFEAARFLGGNTARRLEVLRRHAWMIPFALLAGATGLLQPAAMIGFWFRRNGMAAGWRAIRWTTLAAVALLYISFLFSFRDPSSHTFYLMLPVVFLYGFYCWEPLLRRRAWQVFAVSFLVAGVLFHVGVALDRLPTTSLYRDRARVVRAIEAKDYRIVGERRPGSRY